MTYDLSKVGEVKSADSLTLNGSHKDSGKPRMDLLDPEFLFGIAKVLTFGAVKYGDRNWTGGIAVSKLFGSLQRHLWAYWGGQDIDPESGLPHLWHAGCNLMMIVWMHEHRPDADDRALDGLDALDGVV